MNPPTPFSFPVRTSSSLSLQIPQLTPSRSVQKFNKPEITLQGQTDAVCSQCHNVTSKDAMVECAKCHNQGHPSCMDLPDELVDKVKSYQWQCFACKGCMVCGKQTDEPLILLCDQCDRGCHTYCATPKLDALPSGLWACSICKGGE